MEELEITEFRKTVWDFYREHGRHDLPWRIAEQDGSFDPYKILVSEIMLQQTQVGRVIPKYQGFLAKFPGVTSLSRAPLGEILGVWSGLGYNRRAKFLWQSAHMIEHELGAVFPRKVNELQKLPGVGANTAGAIMAYAFNEKAVFIETNIRTVFIYHFFKEEVGIQDKRILDLVEQTLDNDHPRIWFWALMDYGSYLKQSIGNVSRASKSYARQSKFVGSKRHLRGQVVKALLRGPRSKSELEAVFADGRLSIVLDDLLGENMIAEENNMYRLFA